MDITELIIEKLNHKLTGEKEQRFNQWLKESYMNEAMMERLEKMKDKGHDFSGFNSLDPEKAWQAALKKDTN